MRSTFCFSPGSRVRSTIFWASCNREWKAFRKAMAPPLKNSFRLSSTPRKDTAIDYEGNPPLRLEPSENCKPILCDSHTRAAVCGWSPLPRAPRLARMTGSTTPTHTGRTDLRFDDSIRGNLFSCRSVCQRVTAYVVDIIGVTFYPVPVDGM